MHIYIAWEECSTQKILIITFVTLSSTLGLTFITHSSAFLFLKMEISTSKVKKKIITRMISQSKHFFFIRSGIFRGRAGRIRFKWSSDPALIRHAALVPCVEGVCHLTLHLYVSGGRIPLMLRDILLRRVHCVTEGAIIFSVFRDCEHKVCALFLIQYL